jgi:hypothetical protein
MRSYFEMTQADLDKLLSAMKPIPAIALNCGPLGSVQERANAAWAELGSRMGFDPMTVQPNNERRDPKFFTAEMAPITTIKGKPRLFKDGDQWCAVGSDFIDLQVSKAGFGDTPVQAFSAFKDPS